MAAGRWRILCLPQHLVSNPNYLNYETVVVVVVVLTSLSKGA